MAQAILKRIASGDKTAVQDCMNAYGGLIWSLARRLSPNIDDAEDAVQEVFLDLWKNADRFDETLSSETTFVAMIARRRLIDRLRYSKRRISANSIEDLTVEPVNVNGNNLQLCVEAKEAAKALETLRPEQRQVLELSIIQGLSHQEISDATGMPLGTVKTHARRGLIQVREFLGIGENEKEKEATV